MVPRCDEPACRLSVRRENQIQQRAAGGSRGSFLSCRKDPGSRAVTHASMACFFHLPQGPWLVTETPAINTELFSPAARPLEDQAEPPFPFFCVAGDGGLLYD